MTENSPKMKKAPSTQAAKVKISPQGKHDFKAGSEPVQQTRGCSVVNADSAEVFFDASRRLRQGRLVAFPTETVYGLGADGLNPTAVGAIYEMKKRPATDPVILHLAHASQMNDLIDTGDWEKKVAEVLTQEYWPGPLTLVLKASNKVPEQVTAGTGYVGIRVPANPVAQKLLEEFGGPVAAPSANLFGHISPTLADHVRGDFPDQDLMILDGGLCQVGLESTVLAVREGQVEQLRAGGTPRSAWQKTLQKAGLFFKAKETQVYLENPADDKQIAPGQLLRHYSASQPTWLLSKAERDHSGDGAGWQKPTVGLAETVVIDFGGCFKALEGACLNYFDLDPMGNLEEAARGLYQSLRKAELEPGCQAILVYDFSNLQNPQAASLSDRCFRAAQGRKAVCTLAEKKPRIWALS